MNPLTKFLQALPERVRLGLYALVFIAGLVYAATQANGGDWKAAIGSVLVSLFGGALPAGNTPKARAKNQKGQ